MFMFNVFQQVKVGQSFEFGIYDDISSWLVKANSGVDAISQAKLLSTNAQLGDFTQVQLS